VKEVAEKYFELKSDPRLAVSVLDGRIFVKRAKMKYDVVVLDAYTSNKYGLSIPPHLVTKEFFEEIRGILSENGILVYNVAAPIGEQGNHLTRAMVKTIAAVFPQVYVYSCKTSWNTMIVATRETKRSAPEAVKTRAAALVEKKQVVLPDFADVASSFRTETIAVDDVPVLTDDYAPIEKLWRDESVNR
jgi:spermidine synthase